MNNSHYKWISLPINLAQLLSVDFVVGFLFIVILLWQCTILVHMTNIQWWLRRTSLKIIISELGKWQKWKITRKDFGFVHFFYWKLRYYLLLSVDAHDKRIFSNWQRTSYKVHAVHCTQSEGTKLELEHIGTGVTSLQNVKQ